MAHGEQHLTAHGGEELEHAHPGARTYTIVGIILAIFTGAEVWAYTFEPLRPILVPLLLVLSACKFAMVVGAYMHLRFDARLLTWLFVGGLVTALAMITGLWALFNGWGG